MMIVNNNEVITFQNSPWNALCKNGILLNIPLFSNPNFKRMFHSIISVQSIAFHVAEIIRLRYLRKIIQISRKNRHFQEN